MSVGVIGELMRWWPRAPVVWAIGRLGQGASILADSVAGDGQLASDFAQGEASDPGLLHRLPERQLARRQRTALR